MCDCFPLSSLMLQKLIKKGNSVSILLRNGIKMVKKQTKRKNKGSKAAESL